MRERNTDASLDQNGVACRPIRERACEVEPASGVGPDGKVVAATDGYLKASHREGDDHEVTITPGVFNDYTVAISPTDWRIAEGDQIRIAVTSGDLRCSRQMRRPVPSRSPTALTVRGSIFLCADIPDCRRTPL